MCNANLCNVRKMQSAGKGKCTAHVCIAQCKHWPCMHFSCPGTLAAQYAYLSKNPEGKTIADLCCICIVMQKDWLWVYLRFVSSHVPALRSLLHSIATSQSRAERSCAQKRARTGVLYALAAWNSLLARTSLLTSQPLCNVLETESGSRKKRNLWFSLAAMC